MNTEIKMRGNMVHFRNGEGEVSLEVERITIKDVLTFLGAESTDELTIAHTGDSSTIFSQDPSRGKLTQRFWENFKTDEEIEVWAFGLLLELPVEGLELPEQEYFTNRVDSGGGVIIYPSGNNQSTKRRRTAFTLVDNQRIALWHEAGHAVAAMSMGFKVVSFGLHPIPHCLVDHKRATKDQMGILLCAGAMMNLHIFGRTWGHHTDFEMAKKLGDLEEFKTKALAVVKAQEQKAKLIVETVCAENAIPMATQERFCDVLPESDPEHAVILAAVAKWPPGKVMVKALSMMAWLQMRFPRIMAGMASISAKLRR